MEAIRSAVNRISAIFSKKIDSLIIVDISSGLELFSVTIQDGIKIDSFKAHELNLGVKDNLIVDALKSFIKVNNIQHKNAILVPSLNSIYIKRIQLPAVSDSELLEAAKWRLKEELPFDFSKALFDYQVIKKSVLADGSKIFDMIFVALPQEDIKKQILLLKQAEISVLSIIFSAFSYPKLIADFIVQDENISLGVLHLSEGSCYLAVCKAGKLEFYRELPIAISKLKKALEATLVTEQGKVQLTPLQINAVLFEQGIPNQDSQAYNDKVTASHVLAMLRPPLEILAQEIKRSLLYYTSQFNAEQAKKIFISAEATKIINLDKFLSRQTGLDVSMFPVIEKIRFSQGGNQAELVKNYASLAGAINYEDNLNLMPYEFRTEKIEKMQMVSLRWVAFIASLLLIVSYFLAHAAVAAYKKRLNNALFQLSVLSEIKQVKIKIDGLDLFFQEIRDSSSPLGAILKKISNISSRELFFETVILNSDSKSGSISGTVKSSKSNPDTIVTKFISDMSALGYFKDVDIAKLTKTNVGGLEAAHFEINFKLQ